MYLGTERVIFKIQVILPLDLDKGHLSSLKIHLHHIGTEKDLPCAISGPEKITHCSLYPVFLGPHFHYLQKKGYRYYIFTMN